jgi:BirA family transcriptional regulator, biotin operon repressor / biotin---[acetyl-CoA-carboxylase] ligase
LALQLAHDRPEEGSVVLTDNQTAGKGRRGHRWVDVPGRNVLSSILLRPLFPFHLLVMLASLAVVDSIAETCHIHATIKWPNDVLVGERKVAGILIETSHDLVGRLVAVLGIGVNVNGSVEELSEYYLSDRQASLITTATTLETVYGHEVSREVFIARMLLHVEKSYLALQQESTAGRVISEPASRLIRERWRGQLSTLGRTISVQQGDSKISGVAEDVNDNGELLLRRHSGEVVTITWGNVEYPAR